jgi:drug/metabolite transporter (DMT)-like permease
MTRAYALERAARLGPVSYLGVVLSHLGGALLLGEATGPAQVAGAALVVGGGLFLAALALREARASGDRSGGDPSVERNGARGG